MLWLLFFFTSNVFADQVVFEYLGDVKKVFWSELYPDFHTTLYCNRTFYGQKGLNMEHVFAASWMKTASNCPHDTRSQCRRNHKRFRNMETDLHNLYPSVQEINSSRGSLIFGDFDDSKVAPYNPVCPFRMVNHFMFEPPENKKGQVARSVLYMAHEYKFDLDLALQVQGFKDLMMSWHCSHPPTEEELRRNSIIFNLQGTQNPYISIDTFPDGCTP